MMRLFFIGILTLTYLAVLSTPSPAQMYWTSAASETETVVAESQSKGPKVKKLAQSEKASPAKAKGEVAEKAPKAATKKSAPKASKSCPFPKDAK